jgi:hypothetical protein
MLGASALPRFSMNISLREHAPHRAVRSRGSWLGAAIEKSSEPKIREGSLPVYFAEEAYCQISRHGSPLGDGRARDSKKQCDQAFVSRRAASAPITQRTESHSPRPVLRYHSHRQCKPYFRSRGWRPEHRQLFFQTSPLSAFSPLEVGRCCVKPRIEEIEITLRAVTAHLEITTWLSMPRCRGCAICSGPRTEVAGAANIAHFRTVT